MKSILKTAALAVLIGVGAMTVTTDKANAFFGGWWPGNWGNWGGPWGGYPYYGGYYPHYGYPAYGYGHYPGYYGYGYPYGGYGYGYPAYGWGGYPGYNWALPAAPPAAPSNKTSTDKTKKN